jgi:hypothetical protein
MRYLIDTNVLIPLEPTSPEHVEEGTAAATELLRALNELGFQVLVHPASLAELERDSNAERLRVRRLLVNKYAQLEQPPPLTRLEPLLGVVPRASNDGVDHSLLAAVYFDAVATLVTEDAKLRGKAARLGLADRVLTVRDALGQLTTLLARTAAAPPPPEALHVPLHNLDRDDPIFDSLRADYGTMFDPWFARCAQEGRRAFVVPSSLNPLRCAGLCVVKNEFDGEYGFGPRALKASTLKVATEFAGNRYGELLLKALFRLSHDLDASHVWLTVFDRHASLVELLGEFGFRRTASRTALDEAVFLKELVPSDNSIDLSALEYHVTFGPPAIRLEDGHVFVVPIQPHYHGLLFPDAEPVQPLLVEARPFGCALRKAYLCHSVTRSLQPGDSLLFYRSQHDRGVWTVGVVEDTFVSCDADEIVERVGSRTVYSFDDIRGLAGRDVLVILFRQDRIVTPHISDGELIANGVIRRGPQSIVRAGARTAAWLADRIAG